MKYEFDTDHLDGSGKPLFDFLTDLVQQGYLCIEDLDNERTPVDYISSLHKKGSLFLARPQFALHILEYIEEPELC